MKPRLHNYAPRREKPGADAGRKPAIELAKEFAGALKPPSHPAGSMPENCALLYSSSSLDPRFKGVIRLTHDGQLYWVTSGCGKPRVGALSWNWNSSLKVSGEPL